MPMSNAERQAAYRGRQADEFGRRARTFFCTADEDYYLGRVLLAMRARPGTYPAMMRNERGQLEHLDT